MNKELELYIKEHLERYSDVDKTYRSERKAKSSAPFLGHAKYVALDECCLESRSIDDYINDNKDENKFQKLLFNHIDRKNLKDSDVYNKANIDRRLFSKIRSDSNYHPSKETVIQLAVALELSLDELEDLLLSASYSLPKNNLFDIIIRFCFEKKEYNLMKINSYLDEYNCKILA